MSFIPAEAWRAGASERCCSELLLGFIAFSYFLTWYLFLSWFYTGKGFLLFLP